MKQSVLILLGVVMCITLWGQDTKNRAIEDIKLVNMAYKSMSKLKFNTSYQVDHDSAGTVVTNTIEGVTIINGRKKFQQLGHMETYLNENYFLSIDHQAKNITISSQQVDYSKEFAFLPDNIASAINKCDSVYRIETSGNEVTYGFMTQYSAYDKIELTFQQKTKFISMLKMYNTENKQLITIKYFNFTSKAIPQEDWFSYQRFLAINNDKLVSKPLFAQYQLFSQVLDIHQLK